MRTERARDGPPAQGLFLRLFGRRLSSFVVVLLVVNLLAVLVLFAVYLFLLLRVESAAVGGAVVVDLLVDCSLVAIGPLRKPLAVRCC